MLRFSILAIAAAALAGCGDTTGGRFVSPDAEHLGGNLFIENIDGGRILVLDGEISGETAYVFQSLVEQSEEPGTVVIAQSPGGDLVASHLIGKTIRREGLETVALGPCISACVNIFIAGETRSLSEFAVLGLHASDGGQHAFRLDKRYWDSFQLGRVITAAYEVPFEDIWIIPPDRAKELRLATEILIAEPDG